MKQTMKVLTLAAVLGVMVFSSTTAMAAPRGGIVAPSHASISLLDAFVKFLGFQPAAPGRGDNPAPTSKSPVAAPHSGTGAISTDGAIWGRCLLLGTC